LPSRRVVNFVVTIAAVAYLVAYVAQGAPLTSDFARPFAAAAAVAALLLQAFDRFLWRWPGFQYFARRPNVRGTWRGTLASQWHDPKTGKQIPPDPEVYLVIDQTYWSASVGLFTQESRSRTLTAQVADDGSGNFNVVGIYRNVPRAGVRHRSPIHHGTLMLDISGSPVDRLEGFYWTDRKTMGDLEFARRRPELVNDFRSAQGLNW
jgi:hypothetical protein